MIQLLSSSSASARFWSCSSVRLPYGWCKRLIANLVQLHWHVFLFSFCSSSSVFFHCRWCKGGMQIWFSCIGTSSSSASAHLLLCVLIVGGAREVCRSGSAGATGGCGVTFQSCRSSCGVSAAGDTSPSPLLTLFSWPSPLLGSGSESSQLTTPSGEFAFCLCCCRCLHHLYRI